MTTRSFLFVLGRPDVPTDGVEDYCQNLGAALHQRGSYSQFVRVRWDQIGWAAALWRLWRDGRAGDDHHPVMQVTSLAWSHHGVPIGALAVAAVLRLRFGGMSTIFHDPRGFPGQRARDIARRFSQYAVMAALSWLSAPAMATVVADRIPWARVGRRLRFVLVGSNIPMLTDLMEPKPDAPFTVAVFGVTEGSVREAEELATAAMEIAGRLRYARLLLLGRGSDTAGPIIVERLGPAPIEVVATGVLPAHEVSHLLASAHVLLHIRGPAEPRRSSLVAGLAHGLPIVAYSGDHITWPMNEAGLVLVEPGDVCSLGAAIATLADNPDVRRTLADRSRAAYARHFAWPTIAGRFDEVLACAR